MARTWDGFPPTVVASCEALAHTNLAVNVWGRHGAVQHEELKASSGFKINRNA